MKARDKKAVLEVMRELQALPKRMIGETKFPGERWETPTQHELRDASKARSIKAANMREAGLTFKEIAIRLGVGIERARQITFKGELLKRRLRNERPES